MRNRFRCSSILVVLGLLTACGSDRPGSGTGGGTVFVSMLGDASALFPLTTQDETGRMVTDLLFDHLAEIGDGMSTIGDVGFQPRLAKSWDWGPDSSWIVFHIDPAARFHDGVPVRSSDVRYTLKLINDPSVGSVFAPLVTNIDSISAPDSVTAKVWFKKHLPEEFYDVAYQIPVVPEHVYGKVPPADLKTSDLMRHPVGTGPFRLARWDGGSRIELLADTANYRGRAKLDRLVLDVNQAPPAAATAVLTGESDFFEIFPVDQAHKLDSNTTAQGQTYVQMAYGFLALRAHVRKSLTQPHPILGDRAVRRAISMSLDRAAMLANVFNGKGVACDGPFPAGAATADTTLRLPAYDTTAAKALLDSAGWRVGPGGIREKNGKALTFEIMVTATSPSRGRYADLIQEQLKRVGIQAELGKVPGPVFVSRLNTGDFEATLNVQSTDPSVSGTKQYWGTEGEKAGTNYMSYANPKVDALLDSAGHAQNLSTARSFATKAYQAIIDDVPAVWLYDLSSVAAVNRRIVTQPLRADGWWAHLADWSIPADKRIDRDRIGLTPKTP